MASSQVQCPNCGGYRTSSFPYYVNKLTRERISESTPRGCIVLPLTMVVAFLAVIILTIPIYANQGIFFENIVAIFATIVAVIAGILVYVFYVKQRQNKKRDELARAQKVYNSSCSLCGYAWEWDDGRPRQDIQVRPDLMQKGDARLAEERRIEERKREEQRRQDAMAAWYMEQQRKKKQQ